MHLTLLASFRFFTIGWFQLTCKYHAIIIGLLYFSSFFSFQLFSLFILFIFIFCWFANDYYFSFFSNNFCIIIIIYIAVAADLEHHIILVGSVFCTFLPNNIFSSRSFSSTVINVLCILSLLDNNPFYLLFLRFL